MLIFFRELSVLLNSLRFDPWMVQRLSVPILRKFEWKYFSDREFLKFDILKSEYVEFPPRFIKFLVHFYLALYLFTFFLSCIILLLVAEELICARDLFTSIDNLLHPCFASHRKLETSSLGHSATKPRGSLLLPRVQ